MTNLSKKRSGKHGGSIRGTRAAFGTTALLASLIAIYPGFITAAHAATGNGDTSSTGSDGKVELKTIQKKYKKLKVGQKNITSAMSVISKEDIEKSSSSQSIYSILKSTPSVNEYQQNIGPGTPVLTIRGVRMSQLAQTLDGVPMTSLLSGGQGAFLDYNVGSMVSTGQIDSIHVYPGVAPPDRGGFATVGGTVNYKTKEPTDKPYTDIFTKYGSFNTKNYGLEFNSGDIPRTDGGKVLFRLSQTKTDGYIDNTASKYTDMLLSGVKPYNQGLSKLTGTVIYNTGGGYLISAPTPTDLLDQYGNTYNFPLSTASSYQNNKFLTAIVGDENYINDSLVIGGHAYYMKKHGEFSSYTNPAYINADYPYQVNFNSPYFGYGPLGGADGGNNNLFTYDPVATFGSYTAGEAAFKAYDDTTSYGVTPKINIFLPHNDITVGGLLGQETETGSSYVYGTLNMPEIDGYNALNYGGKSTRKVYSAYAQDKINLMDDKLHVEPGITYTVAKTSNFVPHNIYASPPAAYTLSSTDKVTLPYLGVSYDATKNVVAYASYGKGARFAPVQDYVLGPAGSTTVAPGPETVHAMQAGVRYVSDRLYLNADVYQQNMFGMFSFYINYLTGFAQYANIGRERMRGIEFSGKYLLDHTWTVSGGASFNQANYLNSYSANVTPFQGQYGYVFAGQPLAAVPKVMANIALSYENDGFKGSLIAHFTGKQPTTINLPPTESNPLLQDATTPNTSYYLGSYTTLDLHTSYKMPLHNSTFKSITFSANVDNLLNKNYYEHYYNSYKEFGFTAVGAPYSSAYPGEPRFIELGLVARFL